MLDSSVVNVKLKMYNVKLKEIWLEKRILF